MSGKRILVVEDGITMRMFYQDVLGRAGFVVEEAANGVEGLEKALTLGTGVHGPPADVRGAPHPHRVRRPSTSGSSPAPPRSRLDVDDSIGLSLPTV